MASNSGDLAALWQEQIDRIRLALKGFEPGDVEAKGWPGTWSLSTRVLVSPEDIPLPALALFVLKLALKAPNLGRREKLAWELRFSVDGIPCALTHEKFGIRLYTSLDEEAAQNLATRIVRQLKKAISVAERRILAPFAEVQLSKGNVTIRNQYYFLRSMYEHFREQAESTPQPPEPDSDKADDDGLDVLQTMVRQFNFENAANHERFYQTVAMVNAYFSLIEHTLVLAWPFVSFRPGEDDVQRFIGDRWGEKFKKVFDINADTDAKRMYDSLVDAAEEFRNTYAHGGFDKLNGAIGVHIPNLGAIPAQFSAIRDTRHFRFLPLQEADFTSLTELFDDFDEWLRTGPASFGMTYIEAGLDVSFDKRSVRDFRKEMSGDFESYVEATSRMADDITNMDW